MPRGTIDDSNVLKESLVSALSDVGELAVRLGAISSIDRTGDVFIATSFADGFNVWQLNPSGANSHIRLSGQYSRSQGVCARLRAGGAEDDFATLYAFIRNPLSGKLGVELHFTYLTGWKEFILRLAHYVAGTLVDYQIKLDLANDNIYYLNDAGVFSLIGILEFSAREAGEWQVIKLVCDLPNDAYWRLLVNDDAYDLEGYLPQSSASSPPDALLVEMKVVSSAITYADFFIDDILVTANEI